MIDLETRLSAISTYDGALAVIQGAGGAGDAGDAGGAEGGVDNVSRTHMDCTFV